mmetsp:Transcript_32834/g.76643  ORF Transcript_32834/g.76643 Transcript_32834/m.76643 type:complete len:281 (+) Transcript_32834:85-927(+)
MAGRDYPWPHARGDGVRCEEDLRAVPAGTGGAEGAAGPRCRAGAVHHVHKRVRAADAKSGSAGNRRAGVQLHPDSGREQDLLLRSGAGGGARARHRAPPGPRPLVVAARVAGRGCSGAGERGVSESLGEKGDGARRGVPTSGESGALREPRGAHGRSLRPPRLRSRRQVRDRGGPARGASAGVPAGIQREVRSCRACSRPPLASGGGRHGQGQDRQGARWLHASPGRGVCEEQERVRGVRGRSTPPQDGGCPRVPPRNLRPVGARGPGADDHESGRPDAT